jgi:hypothetical protein
MSEIKRGTCPFYKYKATDTSEILTCEATHESVSLPDSDSLTRFASIIDKDCLGFDYVKCPEYKKKMKSESRNE